MPAQSLKIYLNCKEIKAIPDPAKPELNSPYKCVLKYKKLTKKFPNQTWMCRSWYWEFSKLLKATLYELVGNAHFRLNDFSLIKFSIIYSRWRTLADCPLLCGHSLPCIYPSILLNYPTVKLFGVKIFLGWYLDFFMFLA